MAETEIEKDDLLGRSPLPDLNPEERRYSVHVRETLMKVLRGGADHLNLMTRYHQEPDRLGVLQLPSGVDPSRVRLSKVDEILSCSLRFLHNGSDGGPIAQYEDHDGGKVLQRRDFPTRFPHIVIERVDVYEGEKMEPMQSSWSVHRLQNQRHNILINRVLDAMNLGIELLKFVR